MRAIPQAAKDAVQPALRKSADELSERMRGLAPQDQGDLIASIRVEPGEHELAVTVKAGDQKAWHARFIEFGTVKMPAQPYFWPSYRLLRKRIEGRIKRAVSAAVKREWTR